MRASRAALGLAGVAMAVAVTITSLAINEGAMREARRDAERLGLDTILLRNTPRSLTVADARWIAELRPAVAVVAPVVRGASRSQAVLAVAPGYSRIRSVAIAGGRFLNAADDVSAARVCVLGARAALEMFGRSRAVGERVRIGRDWFLVIGTAAAGTGADDEIFVPLSAYAPRTTTAAPHQSVDEIWIGASPGSVSAAEQALRRAIGTRPDLAGVELVVARDLVRARDRTLRMFTRVTGLMGLLLFALGALAIANVMLTSVLERRSEIGVRRAVGATCRRIVAQFLREAGLLGAAGATAGVLGGALLSLATARIAGWPAAFGALPVLVVPAGAIAIGVAAGLYPALSAARIQPIDALSHE